LRKVAAIEKIADEQKRSSATFVESCAPQVIENISDEQKGHQLFGGGPFLVGSGDTLPRYARG